MSTPKLVIVTVALLASACRATVIGPPEIVVDRAVCSHCGMFVSEPAYAAAYQAGGNDPRVFDDIGCMLDAVRRETAAPISIWLQDAAGGGWIAVERAFVVASERIQSPMHGGLLAYADAAPAEKAAAGYRGRVLRSLPELLAWNGESR